MSEEAQNKLREQSLKVVTTLKPINEFSQEDIDGVQLRVLEIVAEKLGVPVTEVVVASNNGTIEYSTPDGKKVVKRKHPRSQS